MILVLVYEALVEDNIRVTGFKTSDNLSGTSGSYWEWGLYNSRDSLQTSENYLVFEGSFNDSDNY